MKNLFKSVSLFLFLMGLISQPLLSSHTNSYVVSKIIANTSSFGAFTIDPNLVNPWGLTFDNLGDPIVSDNGTDLSTSYTPLGGIIGAPVNVAGGPTGIVHSNSCCEFHIGSTSVPAQLIFATESGTILAWSPFLNSNTAVVVVDRSGVGAVYKGLAKVEVDHEHFLFATDFHNGQIDMFDSNFNLIKSFTDPTIPAGFAPFNVVYLDDKLYITFAKQLSPQNHDDQAGPGNGFVDVFTETGYFIKRLISNGALNSPWGVTIAPHHFGAFSKALLVGNFGDGHINAFDRRSGAFLGTLNDTSGNPIFIDGLWAIAFDKCDPRHEDKHTLFFSSGPNGESNGLLGSIRHRH